MVGLNEDWAIEDVQLNLASQTLRLSLTALGCDAVSDDPGHAGAEVYPPELWCKNDLRSLGREAWPFPRGTKTSNKLEQKNFRSKLGVRIETLNIAIADF